MKTIDISPKSIRPQAAADELFTPPLDVPIGQLIGGLVMNSNSFRRGSGNQVFATDNNGSWWGAADYNDAPVRISFDGKISIRNGDNSSTFDADTLIFYEAGVPVIVIGEI